MHATDLKFEKNRDHKLHITQEYVINTYKSNLYHIINNIAYIKIPYAFICSNSTKWICQIFLFNR